MPRTYPRGYRSVAEFCLREEHADAPEIQVQTLAAIRKQFHLNRAVANNLQTLRTLPGIYSMEESVYKSRVTIASVHQAPLAYQTAHTTAVAAVERAQCGAMSKFQVYGGVVRASLL